MPTKLLLRGGLATLGFVLGVALRAALAFYPFITPEMIERAQREHEEKVAALTPEQRAWLSAESDWKSGESRRIEEARRADHGDMARLLEEDIRTYGEPRTG